MPAKSAKVPAYCRLKASGQSVVRIDGRDYYLGRFGSSESHEHYARLIAKWQSRPPVGDIPASDVGVRPAHNLSINEVMLSYVEFAQGYHRARATAESTDFPNESHVTGEDLVIGVRTRDGKSPFQGI